MIDDRASITDPAPEAANLPRFRGVYLHRLSAHCWPIGLIGQAAYLPVSLCLEKRAIRGASGEFAGQRAPRASRRDELCRTRVGDASPSYKEHRHPVEVISPSVWLYFRFPLSFGEVEGTPSTAPEAPRRSRRRRAGAPGPD